MTGADSPVPPAPSVPGFPSFQSPVFQAVVDQLRPAAQPIRPAVLRVATGVFSAVHNIRRRPMFRKLHAQDASQFTPVGVVKVLKKPLPPRLADGIFDAAQVVNLVSTLGVGHRVTGPLNAALQLWTISYRNSWTMLLHSDNMMTMHQVVLGTTRSADALSVDSLLRDGTLFPQRCARAYGAVPTALNVATVAVYFISGMAKVRGPLGLKWAGGDVLRGQIAVDGMRKDLFGTAKPAAGTALYQQKELFTLMAAVSLAVELGAPLSLVNRRLGQVFAVGAWGMHVGIRIVMGIKFKYNVSGVAYLPYFPLGPQLPR
ncbi:hypothetical protein ABDK96_09780 [Citricoccus nitrophenolicus]|uniref:HTTM domain-containing protein n=1 Tax=Citricoccus nitrophenolicus TaxID=863575 RepID=A0ABV0IIR7_9MICC|nr:hypothetical protein [Citricoccus sp. I39-566]WMY77809.1 hypothetical protein RE421_13415 [Citricoccus sp. I39-566]